MQGRIQGFQRQSDGKGWFPETSQELGRGGPASPPFFSPWGCAWILLPWATGVESRLVSPAEGASALALVRFN